MNIWEHTLKCAEKRLSSNTFHAFFKRTALDHQEGTTLFIRVPSGVSKLVLEKSYPGIVRASLADAQATVLNVEYRKNRLVSHNILDGTYTHIYPRFFPRKQLLVPKLSTGKCPTGRIKPHYPQRIPRT